MDQRSVYVVGGQRTPFVKSMTVFNDKSNQELMTATLVALIKQYGLNNQVVGDVAIGATIQNSLDWDFARECVLGSGLHPYTPAYTVQRACGSGLETTWQIALKIAAGQIDSGIAGGVDTNSDLPMMLSRATAHKLLLLRFAKNALAKAKRAARFRCADLKIRTPDVREPRTGLSMGEHCEKMVKEWQINQVEQDQLALISHQHADQAYKEGFYDDLIFEYCGIKKDTILRADTSLEKLAKLKPAFDFTGTGTLTAGNSTPLTDGASAVLLASADEMQRQHWQPQARFVDAQVAAIDFVHGDGLLMAPTLAVAKLINRNGLSLQDFDFYEIHEAFSGQVLCTLKAWESTEYCQRVLKLDKPLGAIDRNKLNIKGGSVALGHPFAATGARIVAGLAKLLKQSGKGRGLISICTAGGMGVAAILEAV